MTNKDELEDGVNKISSSHADHHGVDNGSLASHLLQLPRDHLEERSICESNSPEPTHHNCKEPPHQSLSKELDTATKVCKEGEDLLESTSTLAEIYQPDSSHDVALHNVRLSDHQHEGTVTLAEIYQPDSSHDVALHNVRLNDHQHEGTVTLAEIYQPDSSHDVALHNVRLSDHQHEGTVTLAEIYQPDSSHDVALHNIRLSDHQHEGTVTFAEIYQPDSEHDREGEYVEPISLVSNEAAMYIPLQRGYGSRHLYNV